MSFTGKQFLDVKSKKLLGITDLTTRFFDYLKDIAQESNKYSFGYGGRFFIPDGVTISADGNDKFKITKDVAGVIGTDGQGNFLDINETERTGIQFENTNAIGYYVGLRHAIHPVGIQINPRTGAPQYECYEDQIGEAAAPDSVVDNGSNITFTVNSVTEDNVDNTGRKVLVWKVIPADGATTEAIAIEECTVSYVSTDNKITTTGLLGQSTVSTTASDYGVLCLGPTVKKSTDLRTVNDCCFIGIVTGAGAGNPPTTFDHSDQIVFSGSWSDMLVDGFSHNLIPDTDDTYDLGSSSLQWKDLYIDGTANIDILALSTDTSEGVGSSLYPTAADTYGIGTVTRNYSGGYFGTLRFDTDFYAVGDVATSFDPDLDDSHAMGNSGAAWSSIYVHDLYYKTQATFDDYDDLSLIENFKPKGEFKTINKGGEKRRIRYADPSSIPWPMLGTKDYARGDYYIHLPDATGFLLGAIKQLYQKHKEEIKKMNERLEAAGI